MNDGNRNSVPRGLWGVLLALAALTLIAELFVDHHAYFGIDGSYAFYAWYTVGVGIIGVLAARVLAGLLGRAAEDDDDA